MLRPEAVCLVTGAGSGIGAAIATALGRRGAIVWCAGRRRQPLETTAAAVTQAGGRGKTLLLDITDSQAVDQAVARIQAEDGRLDVCIANAGVAAAVPFQDTDPGLLARILDVNVAGTFACCRAAYTAMLPRCQGAIITIGSVVSVKGYPLQAAYGASKHAVLGLTRSLCAEAREHGIRVACVLPGGVDTPMARATRPDLDPTELIPAATVAEAVCFLLDLPPGVAVDSIQLRRWGAEPT